MIEGRRNRGNLGGKRAVHGGSGKSPIFPLPLEYCHRRTSAGERLLTVALLSVAAAFGVLALVVINAMVMRS